MGACHIKMLVSRLGMVHRVTNAIFLSKSVHEGAGAVTVAGVGHGGAHEHCIWQPATLTTASRGWTWRTE